MAQIKHRSAVILLAMVTLILLCVARTGFADEPEVVEVKGGEVKVTLLKAMQTSFARKPS